MFRISSRRDTSRTKCASLAKHASRPLAEHFVQKSLICPIDKLGFFCWRRVWDSNPRGVAPKRFSRLLRVVVSSGYFMAAWLISVPLKSLSHKAFCLVLNRSNPNRMGSNRTAFLKISLKSLTFERIWRELDTKKLKMQYSEVGLYWREFLP